MNYCFWWSYEFIQKGVYDKGYESRKRDVFAGYYNIQKDEGIQRSTKK